jgi:long-subunit fatty acid transport protein
MQFNFTLIGLLCFVYTSFLAQNEEDALRFSTTDVQGTARYASMGGAFGALGADISVLSVNPAGMGRYKADVLTGTVNLGVGYTGATLNGEETLTNSENFDLNNLGIIGVSNTRVDNPSPWRKVQFGFAYNRLAEFNDKYAVNGVNDASFSYVLADRGYGRTPNEIYGFDQHYAGLAYENYLIDHVVDSSQQWYVTQMHNDYGGGITHEHYVETVGRIGESAFSIAGNYSDKLYLGATVGVDKIQYSRTKTHFEASNSDSLAIDNFTFVENLTTRGNGVNLKVGAIILPQSWLRLGIAMHTPTNYYYMRDTWNSEIITNFKNGDRFSEESLSSSYVYKMRTPGKLMGSLALVSKKLGLLSVDCEYINYGNVLLKNHQGAGDSYDFNYENTVSEQIYQSALNIRVGGEYKITNYLMARAGYAVNGQPFKNEYKDQATPKIKYSLGLGFRTEQFFIDAAVVHSQQKENYFLYDPILIENAAPTKKWTNALVTLGFKI